MQVKIYGRKDMMQYMPRPWYTRWLAKVGLLKQKSLVVSLPPNILYTHVANLPLLKESLTEGGVDWVDCTKPEFTVIDRKDYE